MISNGVKSAICETAVSDFRVPYCQENYRLVFSDKQLLVVDKPAGLLSVPGRHPDNQDSLIGRVQRHYPEARIVHRLDMATSGLMLMARDADTHRQLSKLFERRQIQKRYLAVVAGTTALQGSIGVPLICDWPRRPRQKVDWQNGKKALTRFRRLHSESAQSTVVLEPVTGRSHQLRLHMAHIGHPILGCEFYAPDTVRRRANRLLLHATQLGFTHPASGEWLTLDSPAPFSNASLTPLTDRAHDRTASV